jgi:hypothetical protein
MIQNEQELKVLRERVAKWERLLETLRRNRGVASSPTVEEDLVQNKAL